MPVPARILPSLLCAALLMPAAAAGAEEAAAIPAETATLGAAQVTLHLHPFLTEEELRTLRLVATNEQALALFVPAQGAGGHAALAISPEEGFIREGKPAASASALADLPDAEAARTGAVAACDGLRKGGAPCVVVLEVAPAAP